MRNIRKIVWIIALAVFAVPAFCHDSSRPDGNAKKGGAPLSTAEVCKLQVELREGDFGPHIPGMIRLLNEAGTPVRIPGLLDRCTGLPAKARRLGWHVLTDPAQISVPREKLTIEAVSGLEYTRISKKIDLTGRNEQTCQLNLTRFWNAGERGFVAGNTHLHLKDLSREEADQYLQEVSKADGLEIVFVSYLERALVDRTYITNQHSRSDLEKLSTKHVHFGNGEEYRHNFGGGGEGYGHVMFLDLKKRILPGSIGPGIAKTGPDGIPLRAGIEQANAQESTVIWCHNRFGFEDIPSWIGGLVQAQNIFDGGNQGSYEDSFYRYLNLGIRVPFSTGTDWFIYDYSRVYTDMGDKAISVSNWLQRFRKGRTFITNGPLLDLSVNGAAPGDVINTESSVNVKYRAVSRENFGELELIQNGKVFPLSPMATSHKGWYEFTGEIDLPITGPSWVALRVSPQSTVKNEFDRKLFAHTSPVYINTVEGKIIDSAVIGEMITEIETNLAAIRERGNFASDEERKNVEKIYQEAISKLRDKQSR